MPLDDRRKHRKPTGKATHYKLSIQMYKKTLKHFITFHFIILFRHKGKTKSKTKIRRRLKF